MAAAKAEVDPQTFLEQWVLHDGKPITARLLSLVRGCHINDAQKQMQLFHQNTEKREGADKKPFTTWIVKGKLKDDTGPFDASQQPSTSDSMEVDIDEEEPTAIVHREGMQLVTQDTMDEIEGQFEEINTKQIYSMGPSLSSKSTVAHKIAAVSLLTTIQHEIHNKKEYTESWQRTHGGTTIGSISSSESWKEGGKLAKAGEAQAGPSSNAIPAAQSKKAPVQVETKKQQSQVKKEPDAPRVGGTKREKSSPKSMAASKPSMTKPAPKSKRKLVDSDEEDDVKGGDDVPGGRRSAATALEDDDDDEEGEGDAGPIGYADDEPASEGATSRTKRADAGAKISAEEEKRRKRKQELMDMMDEDGDADPPAIEEGDSTSTSMMKGTEAKDAGKGVKARDGKADGINETSKESAPKKRVRKQRKVIRKEKTKDSKGYTRTQDVEAYESYSSDESDEPSAPSPRPATAAASAAGAAKKTTAPAATAPAMAKTNSNGQQSAPAAKKAGSATGSGAAGGAAGGQRKLSSFFTKG